MIQLQNSIFFLLALLHAAPALGFIFRRPPRLLWPARSAAVAEAAPAGNQLEKLAAMTVISVDTGDLDVIAELASTGLITDATTNPLFVSQAGLSGYPRYAALVTAAVQYALEHRATGTEGEEEVVALAMDRLAVNLGVEIAKLVPGFVSTEVDPRLSFDTMESVRRARRLIAMYEAAGVPRSRVLVKLGATWEGIEAARALEAEGIRCNLTLIFGFAQAVACAQAKATLISPFPGRILDWHKARHGFEAVSSPAEDPGVACVKRIYAYFKCHGHGTIVMPASWRPSRGPGFDLDEIIGLAGTDRMTIPPNLLERLRANSVDEMPRALEPGAAAAGCEDEDELGGPVGLTESAFRLLMNADFCATAKMAEGLQAFVEDTEKLEAGIRAKIRAAVAAP